MAGDNVFGSDELTPELLRSAPLVEHDGRYDAVEVRTFLDRVASSVEVFLSADAPAALRAEFARNAEIAQQVLDAGQNASAQLRRQAAEEATRILDETREATTALRMSVEAELERSREQVEGMRGQFIRDLRDLYDRIGASLYRFERAAESPEVAPIAEPHHAAQGHEPVRAPEPETRQWPDPEPEPEPVVAAPHPDAAAPVTPAAAPPAEPAEAIPAPAWQQLPPAAWGQPPTEAAVPPAYEPATTPDVAPPPLAADQNAVSVDEPLAPGEPLVDLREFPQPDDLGGGSWLSATEAEPEPEPAPAAPAELAAQDPALAHDNALAEALIGAPFLEGGEGDGAGAGVEQGNQPAADYGGMDDARSFPAGVEQPVPPQPEPDSYLAAPVDVPPQAAASPDAVAVRQLILDSLAAGQPRESIEAYLRDHMGLLEPVALVDAAINAMQQPGPPA